MQGCSCGFDRVLKQNGDEGGRTTKRPIFGARKLRQASSNQTVKRPVMETSQHAAISVTEASGIETKPNHQSRQAFKHPSK
jgi:hypothetical protein